MKRRHITQFLHFGRVYVIVYGSDRNDRKANENTFVITSSASHLKWRWQSSGLAMSLQEAHNWPASTNHKACVLHMRMWLHLLQLNGTNKTKSATRGAQPAPHRERSRPRKRKTQALTTSRPKWVTRCTSNLANNIFSTKLRGNAVQMAEEIIWF